MTSLNNLYRQNYGLLSLWSPNKISSSNIYIHYEFKDLQSLNNDSAMNKINLTNIGGGYVYDGYRHSIILKSGNEALIPKQNWDKFNDLTLSFWFKTEGFQNNDKIIEFGDVTDNLYFWYKFNGQDYLKNYGLLGSKYDLTPSAGHSLIISNDRVLGENSIEFTSTNGYLYIANSYDFSQNFGDVMTISYWVKRKGWNNSWDVILYGFTSMNANGNVVIHRNNDTNGWYCVLCGYTFSTNGAFEDAYSDLNAWNHYVWIAERVISATKITLYKNGVQVFTSTSAQGIWQTPNTGFMFSFSNTVSSIIGNLDDFRIYNKKLSVDEVKQLYACNNIKIMKYNNKLSFQINDNVIMEKPYIDNQWNNVLWNLKNSSNTQSFIKIQDNEKGPVYPYSKPKLVSNTYINTLGSVLNTSNLYISDFLIYTNPLTSNIEEGLYDVSLRPNVSNYCYLNYKFLPQNFPYYYAASNLNFDYSSNNRSFTNNGGVYAYNGGSNSLWLQSGKIVSFANTNWGNFNDLSISGWYKWDSFVNISNILRFETSSASKSRIAIENINNRLSFIINNEIVESISDPIYNNTWYYILWNITNTVYPYSYVKLISEDIAFNQNKYIYDQYNTRSPILFPPSAMTDLTTNINGIRYRSCSLQYYNNDWNYSSWRLFDRNNHSKYISIGVYDGSGNLSDWNAFFNSETNFRGVYVGIDMGQQFILKTYKFFHHDGNLWGRRPRNWKIYATNNNACWNENGGTMATACFNTSNGYGWFELDYRSSQTSYDNYTLWDLTSNYLPFRYYALHVNAIIGSPNSVHFELTQWYIYGYPIVCNNLLGTTYSYYHTNKLGSRNNVGSLMISDFKVINAPLTTDLENYLINETDYNDYLHYKFESSNLLIYDSSGNDKSYRNYGGVYTVDNLSSISKKPKESVLFSTSNYALLPSENWSTYSNLTISGWFNTSNFVQGDEIIKISNSVNIGDAFVNDTTNLKLWYKFNTVDFLKNFGALGSLYDLLASSGSTIAQQSTDRIRGDASAQFTATNGYLYTSRSIDFASFTTGMSISFWLKRKGLTTSDVILYGFTSGTTNVNLVIQRDGTNSRWVYNLVGSGAVTTTFADYTADNIWNHYAWIIEKSGTAVKVTLYKNGIPVHVNTAGTWSLPNTGLIFSFNNTANCLIGNLDDFRVYDKVLNPVEVYALYAEVEMSINLQNNLLALYNFDYLQLNIDSSGNGNTLTNNSVVSNTTEFITGYGCAQFSGSSYFQIANDGRFSPDNFTVSCWCKIVRTSVSTDYISIASCRNGLASGWNLYVNGSHNLEFWCMNGSWNGQNVNVFSGFAASPAVWRHVVVTYVKSTTEVKVYINGVLIYISTRAYTNNTGTTLRIGAGANETTPNFYLINGSLIDDFRFYNRDLHPIEIYKIYCGNENLQYKFNENLFETSRKSFNLPISITNKNLVNNGGTYAFDSGKNTLLLTSGKDASILPGNNWSNYSDLTIAGWFKTVSFGNNDTLLRLQYTFDDFEITHPIISSNYYYISDMTPIQIASSTDYYITFTDPNVTYFLNVPKNMQCELLVVGGGGGGGYDGSGGGGGGQVKFYTNRSVAYKSGDAYTFTTGTYVINVGGGGTANGGKNNGGGKPSMIRDAYNNILLYAGGGGGGGNRAEIGGNAMGGGGGGGHSYTYIGGLSTNDVYPIIWYNFNEDPSSLSKYATNYLYDSSIINEDLNGLTINASDNIITRAKNGLLFRIYSGYFSDDTKWFLNRTPYNMYQGFTTSISDIGTGTNSIISGWDSYSVEWVGYFYANATGTWTFYLNSDDSSYLWIGANAVSAYSTANHIVRSYAGLGEQSGTINLVAGSYYPMRIQYGDFGGPDNIVFSFKSPIGSKTTDGFGYFFSFPSKYHMKINSFHNDTSNLSHWYYFDSTSSYYLQNYGNTESSNNLILPSSATNQPLLDINDKFLTSTPITIESDILYTSVGTFTFTVPADTYVINVVCVGGGGGGYASYASAGGGGGLVWANKINVVPGQQFTVTVGTGGAGTINGNRNGSASSIFNNSITITAGGGTDSGGTFSVSGISDSSLYGGGNGGNGGNGEYSGGGGAGGYTGNGGNAGQSGAGGGGGGGSSGGRYERTGGGGVGLYGIQGSGNAGGQGGSGGNNGGISQYADYDFGGGAGGAYGGGGGGGTARYGYGGNGAQGAVRIMCSSVRSFPYNASATFPPLTNVLTCMNFTAASNPTTTPKYLTIPTNNYNGIAYTFSFWMSLNTTLNTTSDTVFADTSSSMIIQRNAANNYWNIKNFFCTDTLNTNASLNDFIANNGWCHYVFIAEQSGSPAKAKITIYRNGISVYSATSSTNWVAQNSQITLSSSVAGNSLLGKIDDFRIYTRQLALQEIQYLYNIYNLNYSSTSTFSFTTTTNLVCWYQFNSGAITTDSSGNSRTLTNNSTVSLDTSDFRRGNASASFGGTNYLSITNDGTFSPTNFSICFWCKLVYSYNIDDYESNIQTIASCGSELTGWKLQITNKDSGMFSINMALGYNNTTWYIAEVYQLARNDFGQWIHITFTWDANTETAISYVNGIYHKTVTGQKYTQLMSNKFAIGSYNRNSILLETNKDATLPSEDWSTFSDLTISGWFKTSALADGDKLLEFATPIPTHPFTVSGITPVSVGTLGDYYVTFTSGSYTVTFTRDTRCDILLVGGGGGGGSWYVGGGGGGGGVVFLSNYTVTKGLHTVTVGVGGQGGLASTTVAGNGGNSSFDYTIAYGGGAGGTYLGPGAGNGLNGGCGGGAGWTYTFGTGSQGYNGGGAGNTPYNHGGGGGGMGSRNDTSGVGGNGVAYSITGTSTYYGGGGGAGCDGFGLAGGLGGGGTGGNGNQGGASASSGTNGTTNTGGGGGGAGGNITTIRGGDGGSGIIIIRYNPGDIYPSLKYPRENATTENYTYTDGTAIRITGSSTYNPSNPVYYASFNGNINEIGWTSWLAYDSEGNAIIGGVPGATYRTGYSGEWIMIDLGESIILEKYRIYGRSDLQYRLPKTFRLYASTDSNSWNNINHEGWVQIDDRISQDIANYASLSYGEFIIPVTNKPYRYFVLITNKIYGSSYDVQITIAEFELYGRKRPDTFNNIVIKKINTNLSFQINNTPVYTTTTTFPNNTWAYILWNIINNSANGFVRLSVTSGSSTENTYTKVIPNSGTYINKLGNTANISSINISSFRVLTIPLTSQIKTDVIIPTASISSWVYYQFASHALTTDSSGNNRSLTNNGGTYAIDYGVNLLKNGSKVDDFRLYNTVLTADQIKQIIGYASYTLTKTTGYTANSYIYPNAYSWNGNASSTVDNTYLTYTNTSNIVTLLNKFHDNRALSISFIFKTTNITNTRSEILFIGQNNSSNINHELIRVNVVNDSLYFKIGGPSMTIPSIWMDMMDSSTVVISSTNSIEFVYNKGTLRSSIHGLGIPSGQTTKPTYEFLLNNRPCMNTNYSASRRGLISSTYSAGTATSAGFPISSNVTICLVGNFNATNSAFWGGMIMHGNRDSDLSFEQNNTGGGTTTKNWFHFQTNSINTSAPTSGTVDNTNLDNLYIDNNTPYILFLRYKIVPVNTTTSARRLGYSLYKISDGTIMNSANRTVTVNNLGHFTGDKELRIGISDNTSTVENFAGSFGEVLYYQTELNASEESTILNYLLYKWGGNSSNVIRYNPIVANNTYLTTLTCSYAYPSTNMALKLYVNNSLIATSNVPYNDVFSNVNMSNLVYRIGKYIDTDIADASPITLQDFRIYTSELTSNTLKDLQTGLIPFSGSGGTASSTAGGGGGGGAYIGGRNGVDASANGGTGGAGIDIDIIGVPFSYGGGGGGGSYINSGGSATHGGGSGGSGSVSGYSAAPNTGGGGGGGGGGSFANAGAGGSGIVVLRYSSNLVYSQTFSSNLIAIQRKNNNLEFHLFNSNYNSNIVPEITIKGVKAFPNLISNNTYYVAFTETGTNVNVVKFPYDIICDILMIGGGGGGGYSHGGGGGAGSVVFMKSVPFNSGTYTFTVGEGGTGGTSANKAGSKGGNSIITSNNLYNILIAEGGGASTGTGGSGGGGDGWNEDATISLSGGSVGTDSVFIHNGVTGIKYGTTGANSLLLLSYAGSGGGGGGAGAAGTTASFGNVGGNGGDGIYSAIVNNVEYIFSTHFNTSLYGDYFQGYYYFAGGGGGGIWSGITGNPTYVPNSPVSVVGSGGKGGGGSGGWSRTSIIQAVAGKPNTGSGGGGGGEDNGVGAAGGSGIILIRYTLSNVSTSLVDRPLYNISYPLENTWTHIIWNILNSSSHQGFIQINNGNKTYFNEIDIVKNKYKFPRYPAYNDNYSYLNANINVKISASSRFNNSNLNWHQCFNHITNDSGWRSENSRYNSTNGNAINTFRSGYNGEYIQIDLGENIMLTSYTLYASQLNNNRSPKNFRLYASSNINSWTNINHSSWVLLDDEVNSILYDNISASYAVNINSAFRYFALIINQNFNNDTSVQIAEWELYGYINPNVSFTNKIASTTNTGSLYVSDFRVLTTNTVDSSALYNGIYVNDNLLHYEFKSTDTLTFNTMQLELYRLNSNATLSNPLVWYQFDNNTSNTSNIVTLYDIGVVYDCNVIGSVKYNMDVMHLFDDTINLYFWYRFDNNSDFVKNYGLTGTTYNLNTGSSTTSPVPAINTRIDSNDYIVGSGSFDFTTNYSIKCSTTYNYATNFANAISISFWAKITNLRADGNDTILSTLGTIRRNGTANTWNISLFGGSYTSSTANFTYVADSNWNHYVFIAQKGGTGSTQVRLLIYKNGVAEVTGTYAGTYSAPNVSFDLSSTTTPFIGKLDDLRIYNRVITDSEIIILYSYNILTLLDTNYSLTNWYRFEDDYNNSALSLHNLTTFGMITLDSSVFKRGTKSVKLSANAYLENSAFSLNNGDFSISLWVKTPSASGTYQSLLSFWKTSETIGGVNIDNLFMTKQPYARYSADNWDSAQNILLDTSGNNRHSTAYQGTINYNTGSGYGASANISYLSGSTTAGIQFPSDTIPSTFTICSVTRYAGASRGRIIDSGTGNWLHGHWNGNRGVCYYDQWMTNTSSVGINENWLVMCGKNSGTTPNNILADGSTVGTSTGGAGGRQFSINYGATGERSDWAFAHTIIWNQALTDTEMAAVSTLLQSHLSTGKNVNEIGAPLFSLDIQDNNLIFLKTNRPYITSTGFANDTWKHVVLTHNSIATKLYVDSVQVGNISSLALNKSGVTRIKIGGNMTDNTYIDDFRVYNTSLTDNEIKYLYNITPSFQASSLIYPNIISKTTGFNLMNYSYLNAYQWNNVNRLANNNIYLVYNGAATNIQSLLNTFHVNGGFTIYFIFKTANITSTSQLIYIGNSAVGDLIRVFVTNATLTFKVGSLLVNANIVANVYYTVDLTFSYVSGGNMTINVYLNSSLIATGSATYNNLLSSANVNTTGLVYYIGKYTDTNDATPCLLQDLRMIPTVMTSLQINTLQYDIPTIDTNIKKPLNIYGSASMTSSLGSLEFNTNTSYLANTLINLSNRSFSVSFWVRLTGLVNNDTIYWIMSQGTTATSRTGILIGWFKNVFRFSFISDDLDSPIYDYTIVNNIWVHIACTYDMTTNVQSIYKDGVLVATRLAGGFPVATLGTWRIGYTANTNYQSSPNFTFKGNIVDFRIYYCNLTTTEVAKLYDNNINVRNLKIVKNNDRLSFQVDNVPLFENYLQNNTWYKIDWNITNTYSPSSYITLNETSIETPKLSLLAGGYSNYIGSFSNVGHLYVSDFKISTDLVANKYVTQTYLNYSNINIYPKQIKVYNDDYVDIDEYVFYQFKNQNMLTTDSSRNKRNLTLQNGVYVNDFYRNSLLLCTSNQAIVPGDNVRSRELSISTWYKTEGFQDGDIILQSASVTVTPAIPVTTIKSLNADEYSILFDNTNQTSNIIFSQHVLCDILLVGAGGNGGTGAYGGGGGGGEVILLQNISLFPNVNYTVQVGKDSAVINERMTRFFDNNSNIFIVARGGGNGGSSGTSATSGGSGGGGFGGASAQSGAVSGTFFSSLYSRVNNGNAGTTNTVGGAGGSAGASGTGGTAASGFITNINGPLALEVGKGGNGATSSSAAGTKTLYGEGGNGNGGTGFKGVVVIRYRITNMSIRRRGNFISYQINNIPIFETPFIDNTWFYILWNIDNSLNKQGFIKINQNPRFYFSTGSSLTSGIPNIILGSNSNKGALYLSDFAIITIPITSTVEKQLYYSYNQWRQLVDENYMKNSINNINALYFDSSKKLETNQQGIGVKGNLLVTSNIVTSFSDMRLKNVISSGIDNALEKVSQINTFKYVPNDLAKSLQLIEDQVHVGVSAQDVMNILPEAVVENNEFLSVPYQRLIPLLVDSIKELKREIDDLEYKNIEK